MNTPEEKPKKKRGGTWYGKYNPDWGKKATVKYMKEKQRRVGISWKKDEFNERIAPAIESTGTPIATFIKEAVDEKIDRLSSDDSKLKNVLAEIAKLADKYKAEGNDRGELCREIRRIMHENGW